MPNPPADEQVATRLRQLWLRLTTVWSAAWLLGIGAFAVTLLWLASRLEREQVDSRLRMQAIGVFGLAFFDEQGVFHSELLRHEDDLLRPDDSVWVIQPDADPVLEPAMPGVRIPPVALEEVAREAVNRDLKLFRDGRDEGGRSYRLIAFPTYQGTSTIPKAAIIVATHAGTTAAFRWLFMIATLGLAAGLGAAGIAVGALLARWSLRPLAETMAQRERFISMAAHELRTPLAALKAIHESAAAGHEAAEKSLARMGPLMDRAVGSVEDLLLHARLEAGCFPCRESPFRLDLLVETCFPEETSVRLDLRETIVHGDDRLIATAVRNLVANALHHATSPAAVRVQVREGCVVVEDDGPGFPAALLEQARKDFKVAPSETGRGLGLPSVQLIARMHGGRLELSSLKPHGARASLILARGRRADEV